MTDAVQRPPVAASPSFSRGSLVAYWPWLLPVVATCAGWASVLALRSGAGSGHLHHLMSVSAMTVAMMSPLAIPACTAAARSSLWPSSTRCVVAALTTFLAVWIAAGTVRHIGTEALVGTLPAATVTALLAGWCAIDTMSRRRSARLTRCSVSRPLWPGAPMLSTVELGAVSAVRCIGTCWAAMALAVAQPRLAVPVSVLIVLERLVTPRPRGAIAAAFGLVAVAALSTIWR